MSEFSIGCAVSVTPYEKTTLADGVTSLTVIDSTIGKTFGSVMEIPLATMTQKWEAVLDESPYYLSNHELAIRFLFLRIIGKSPSEGIDTIAVSIGGQDPNSPAIIYLQGENSFAAMPMLGSANEIFLLGNAPGITVEIVIGV